MTDWKELARKHEESANEYARMNYELEAELAKLNYIELPNKKVSNVFEAYIAWKLKATKLEAINKDLLEACKYTLRRLTKIRRTDLCIGADKVAREKLDRAIRKAEESAT